jgi:hypothetical protein
MRCYPGLAKQQRTSPSKSRSHCLLALTVSLRLFTASTISGSAVPSRTRMNADLSAGADAEVSGALEDSCIRFPPCIATTNPLNQFFSIAGLALNCLIAPRLSPPVRQPDGARLARCVSPGLFFNDAFDEAGGNVTPAALMTRRSESE